MAVNKWQISDELWEKMEPLLPEHRTSHPLGTHRKRVDNRAAMNAILFVLRTVAPLQGERHGFAVPVVCMTG